MNSDSTAEVAEELAYTEGYEWFRNKWIGDHGEMCADLVRCFVPRAPKVAGDAEEVARRLEAASKRGLDGDYKPAVEMMDEAAAHIRATAVEREAMRQLYEMQLAIAQAHHARALTAERERDAAVEVLRRIHANARFDWLGRDDCTAARTFLATRTKDQNNG